MKNNNKYEYWNVIQQHYGQGWEDVSHYEADSQGNSIEKVRRLNKYGKMQNFSLCGDDAKEYRLTGYPTRVIFRKELKAELQTV